MCTIIVCKVIHTQKSCKKHGGVGGVVVVPVVKFLITMAFQVIDLGESPSGNL